MPEISSALSELRRLGLHLNATADAAAAQERRVRTNVRLYPKYRAVGFQLLLLVALLHNLAVFGRIEVGAFLLFVTICEAYVVLSWLALRRWFVTFRPVRGWDLSDIFFMTDLVFWAYAIGATGADRSWLFLVPLLRVADHRAAPRAFVFAWAAPLSYLAVCLWAAAQPERVVDWPVEVVKLAALAAAGFYIAWTGGHIRRLQEQRAAALSVAGELVGRLRDRTERLDQANRARGDLVKRVREGLGNPLVEIVGFSQSLLRGSSMRSPSESDYLQRIHQQARWVLRILDDLPDLPDLTAAWPRVSLCGVLQDAANREAERSHGECWAPAVLNLPDGDLEIRADPKRLTALIGHLLSAARHFGGGAPMASLHLDAATGLPDRLEVAAAVPARVAAGVGDDLPSDLLNPFSASISGDQEEMGARFELNLAQSVAELLGYRLTLQREPALQLTIHLR